MTDHLIQHQHSQEEQDILNWLTPISYGQDHSSHLGLKQPGTGEWLLDSPQFGTWLKNAAQTLFCPGIPGAGKTVLSSIVIDHLTKLFQGDGTVGLAYIYCNFRRKEEQNANNLLSSLLKQLSQSLSPLPTAVRDLYHQHQRHQTRPTWDEISCTLHSVTKSYAKVFIVVDALDECQVSDGGRNKVLSAMFRLQAEYGANIFATSRFVPEITEKFDNSIRLEIRATREDVMRYLQGHIDELPSFVRRNRLLQEDITTQIADAVNGMYGHNCIENMDTH